MTAPLSEQQLAEIAARVEAVTEGPWIAADATDSDVSVVWAHVGTPTARPLGRVAADPDGSFIAHARTDVPALLAEVERLREERHSTNEVLSDGAEALRAQNQRVAELEAALSTATAHVAEQDSEIGGLTSRVAVRPTAKSGGGS